MKLDIHKICFSGKIFAFHRGVKYLLEHLFNRIISQISFLLSSYNFNPRKWVYKNNSKTRKHSSRMRTVRCSDRRGQGCTCQGGVPNQGVPAWGRGCTCPRGCTCLGGVYLPMGMYLSGVYLWTEWQTPVKILHGHNFVADSNTVLLPLGWNTEIAWKNSASLFHETQSFFPSCYFDGISK